mmetsp:Transcript_40120/g.159537  ORF Transcript_40120/g.159537 Transcript_40120/m.159537 type:complete len:93 (+) Transcript_40120:461-739(+)
MPFSKSTADGGRASPWTLCVEKVQLWYLQYKILFAVNVLFPGEAVVFNTLFLLITGLVLYTVGYQFLVAVNWIRQMGTTGILQRANFQASPA